MRSAGCSLRFSEFVDLLVQEVIRADAHAQILQQAGWVDFQKSMESVGGIHPAEGIGPLEYLGLREAKLTFHVEPVRPDCWTRLKRCIRYLLGKKAAPATMACRLVSEETAAASGFTVTITVGRSADDRFVARAESEADGFEGVDVSDILA